MGWTQYSWIQRSTFVVTRTQCSNKLTLVCKAFRLFRMSKRAAHVVGWITAALSLIVALLAAAPFTPAIFFVALLVPAAAMVACRGAVAAALLSIFLCLSAFAVSPLTWSTLAQWPLANVWLGLCLIAVVLCSIHRVRISSKHHAKVEDR